MHPFPYVGSGVAAARKHMECWLCFRDEVPAAMRASVEDGIPAPLAGFAAWTGRVLAFGHADDSLQWVVRAAYDHLKDAGDVLLEPGLPSEEMWEAFNAELDAWLLRVHQAHPIELMIKPIDDEYPTATDAWHEWSVERIPTLLGGVSSKDVGSYLAQLWSGWAQSQELQRQHELLAALDDAARADLRKRQALFEPQAHPTPREPTLDECEQIWRACTSEPSPYGMRLEDQFAVRTNALAFTSPDEDDDGNPLAAHRNALSAAGRHAELVELCRAVLASGAEFPAHWTVALVDALTTLGRLDEARRELPRLIALLESYHPDSLRTAMQFHAAAGEVETEAMLFHAGIAWFTSFASSFSRTEAKRFGSAPADLAAQFARWYIAGCSAAGEFEFATQTRFGHFLVWFDKVGRAAFGEWPAAFVALRDRVVAQREALGRARDEATASAILDAALGNLDAEDAATLSRAFGDHAPRAAYRLLVGAITQERREGYRFRTGERVDAIVQLTYRTLSQPVLAEKLAEAYAIARGYELVRNALVHYNLGCCAARLGERDAALRHIARALELNYEEPEAIYRDSDLDSLRGDAAFEALFAKPAAAKKSAAKKKAATKKKAAAKKPAAKKAAAKKPAAKKAAKKPAAKKPAAKKPAAKKTATKKSAAKKRR